MAATRQDVDKWIKRAIEKECKFIISVCDTFDYEDYPIYIKTEPELIEKYEEYKYNKNMQRINEIIKINDDESVIENFNIKDL